MTVALALLLAGAAPQASAPLAPVAFRDRMAAAARAATGKPVTVVDARTFRATTAGGTQLTISIDNSYQAYLADPARLEELIAGNVAVLARTDEAPDDEVDQLVVIVRPTDYIVRSLPPGASTAKMLAGRPMAGDLSFFLAVDSPRTIRTASAADLTRWQMSEEQAWTRARANIKQRMGPLTPIRIGEESGASGFRAASGLTSSLLADPGVCRPASPEGVHGQIVLVADRERFLYAIPDDGAQTRTFWAAVRDLTVRHASMSETPLTCRGGKWVVVTPP